MRTPTTLDKSYRHREPTERQVLLGQICPHVVSVDPLGEAAPETKNSNLGRPISQSLYEIQLVVRHDCTLNIVMR